MLLENKLEIIQEILANAYLKIYLDNSFSFILKTIIDYLTRLIPDLQLIPVRLFEYYIVRLYAIYKKAEPEKDDFLQILALAKNAANKHYFGLQLLSILHWKKLSPTEEMFRRLPLIRQKELLEYEGELMRILLSNRNQELCEAENNLSAAVSQEDYTEAKTFLDEVCAINPFSEYAIYYRLYLASLEKADRYALKQSYSALDLWPESREIRELCIYIQSIPLIPIAPCMEIQFDQKLLNMNPVQLENFSFFIHLIKNNSFHYLLSLSYAIKLRQQKAPENRQVHIKKEDVLKFVNHTSAQEGLKDSCNTITVFHSIREMKKNIEHYDWLYHTFQDVISQNIIHNILLYRFTGDREHLKGCIAGNRDTISLSKISLSENLEALWKVPLTNSKNIENSSIYLSCNFKENHLSEIFLNIEN